uniref:Uncharacterized protein n=1 Tax=Arundo donax TaxID=35708 RepID=A0A0A9ALG7_ARUDO
MDLCLVKQINLIITSSSANSINQLFLTKVRQD